MYPSTYQAIIVGAYLGTLLFLFLLPEKERAATQLDLQVIITLMRSSESSFIARIESTSGIEWLKRFSLAFLPRSGFSLVAFKAV
jgi:hypothetical protein